MSLDAVFSNSTSETYTSPTEISVTIYYRRDVLRNINDPIEGEVSNPIVSTQLELLLKTDLDSNQLIFETISNNLIFKDIKGAIFFNFDGKYVSSRSDKIGRAHV